MLSSYSNSKRKACNLRDCVQKKNAPTVKNFVLFIVCYVAFLYQAYLYVSNEQSCFNSILFDLT